MWRARLRGSGVAPKYSGEAQPVVHDGVAYVSTGANDVFALSLDTGEILWQYTANLPAELPSVCCGWNNRGVALSEDKVFMGRLDGKLVALDRKTGAPVWTIQAERPEENFSITPAPVYYDGLVITGFAGADRGTRGRVKAYDADDGRLVWTFYTIPGPGEPGHETWPQDNDSWKYGGGVRVADAGHRSGARARLLLDGQRRPRLQRRRARRRQSLHGVDRRDRAQDRQIPLALPAGASRHLGLRLEQSRRAHGS